MLEGEYRGLVIEYVNFYNDVYFKIEFSQINKITSVKINSDNILFYLINKYKFRVGLYVTGVYSDDALIQIIFDIP